LVGEQAAIAAGRDFSVTLRAHLALRGYPATFGPAFAYPFLAACWGAPLEQIPEFPVYSLLKGMPPGRRPGFFEVEGGMSRYVEAFARSLTHVDVRLGATVARVERAAAQLVVVERSGCRTSFDRVIVATSSRDAAGLLRRMPNTGGLREMRAMGEMQALSASFRHFDTDIVIHGDKTYMPEDPRDWAHNNLFFDGDAAWMTDWQGIRDRVPVFRTWVPLGYAPPTPLYGRRSFHHLVMTPDNALLQRRIAGVQGALGVWLTGMYAVDVDNHESALLSALVPAQALAPRSENLRRLLGAVAPSAPHGLDVLPLPLGVPSKQQQDRPFASLSTR
jgi:predicted NAD/FAD-binding protein